MGKQKILVTSALPYANGPIHFGHIAGAYLPADVFTRFHRLLQDDIVYMCGTDEYGVAVTISAQKEGRTPKDHVDHYHQIITDIFKKFNIEFDHFSRTTNEFHSDLSQKFFKELHDNDHIEAKVEEQLFCDSCNQYLADRYVYGTCYICKHEGARGDECQNCGAWLEPLKIINPKCKVCDQDPIPKKTKHWYLKLSNFKEKLNEWLDGHPRWKQNVLKVAKQQIKELESRPITRDLEWGIKVPLEEAKDKVLYVWFDAPIGYIDATMEWAKLKGQPDLWKEYWQNKDCRIVNFIGKDNIPFHLLVWPSMLMGQTTEYTLAENVPANEFLNLEGRPFSKSEGWYIDLDSFFQDYSSDQIRYALAANAPESADSDFNWRDFQKFNNADLANVLGNLINRTATFIQRFFDNILDSKPIIDFEKSKLLKEALNKKKNLEKFYDSYQLRKAAYEIIDLARIGNKYFDDSKPWVLVKEDKEKCCLVLKELCYLIELISICGFPLIPTSTKLIREFLKIDNDLYSLGWKSDSLLFKEETHSFQKPGILFSKIEDEVIKKEVEKLELSLAKVTKSEPKINYEDISSSISFEDFVKVDLRVAKVLKAEKIKKSNKLLKLQVDLGMEKRQILAGVAKQFSPEELVGRNIIIVANLEPRKMMGEISQGMVLAASLEDDFNLASIENVSPGARLS